MATKKVYKLTESQFEKVIEKSLTRLNEGKESINEMDADTIVGASIMTPAAIGLITYITKNIVSQYKAAKSAHPEYTATQAMLQALSNIGAAIQGAKQ